MNLEYQQVLQVLGPFLVLLGMVMLWLRSEGYTNIKVWGRPVPTVSVPILTIGLGAALFSVSIAQTSNTSSRGAYSGIDDLFLDQDHEILIKLILCGATQGDATVREFLNKRYNLISVVREDVSLKRSGNQVLFNRPENRKVAEKVARALTRNTGIEFEESADPEPLFRLEYVVSMTGSGCKRYLSD